MGIISMFNSWKYTTWEVSPIHHIHLPATLCGLWCAGYYTGLSNTSFNGIMFAKHLAHACPTLSVPCVLAGVIPNPTYPLDSPWYPGDIICFLQTRKRRQRTSVTAQANW